MQVRLHGSRGVSSVATDPPGPRWPPALYLELERERTKEEKEREEVLHLFRCYTHTHAWCCVYTNIYIYTNNIQVGEPLNFNPGAFCVVVFSPKW